MASVVVLVDTSVWIEVFRKPGPFDIEKVVSLDDVVICLPVYQEILQGFDDERAYRLAQEALIALPMVESPLPQQAFDDAVGIYRRARRAGLSIRSGMDCLIAACALRHDLEVLHLDRDYDAIAKVTALRSRRAR